MTLTLYKRVHTYKYSHKPSGYPPPADAPHRRCQLPAVTLRGWITSKHQKITLFKCKFVTVILFGTIFESSRKIVSIVLRALVWGRVWSCHGCGT